VSPRYDAIVIGGGENGLVAAISLARAGRRTLLLERREGLGGQDRITEFAPGFKSAPLGLDAAWLPSPIVRGLGVTAPERVAPEVPLTVAAGDGEWLPLSHDLGLAAAAISRYSASDAARWPAFCARLARHAGFLAELSLLPPPDVDASGLGELFTMLGLARKLRGLGKTDMIELLRTVPMAVQELLDDWFEAEPLKAGLAATALQELRQGPRSGGTSFGLLRHQLGAASGAIRGAGYWRAGPEALNATLTAAARARGVELRTGAEVVRILGRDDQVTGVALGSGEELDAAVVLSSLDPARTLLGLVDPVWLDPDFLLAVRNIKYRGSVVHTSFALDALPEFRGLPERDAALLGTLSLTASTLELERAADAAKYGRVSERPHVELQLPSLRWPELAPAGKQVLVARAQWAPYQLRDAEWTAEVREAVGDTIAAAIERVAPGFSRLVRAREVLTPRELEARYGLTEGAASHGEMCLDQILFMRPVAGASHYALPLDGLFLCGAGAHPGNSVAGGAGWLAARQVLRH
jgi:phytoene dehydrogenase-like protein